jgi:hypothetical protein
VDGHQVGQAVQLRRQGLGRGHHEQRVGQPAPLGPAAGPPRRIGHRRRAGVDPDDQPVRVGGGRRQREPPVAAAEVDGCRPVAGGQVMDLADVHVPGAPALDDPHGPRPPLVPFLVRWQCSGSSRSSQPNSAPEGDGMAAFIKNLTVDCVDALRVARFWAAALGSDVDEESTSERAYVEAAAWGGPNIWFRGGRGPKLAANRMHLDLRALTSMDEEVERLVGLGASVVERFDDITALRDPEGNEFCVEPGPGDPHPASGR